MATGKVDMLSISTRHLIIEYSKKDLSAVHILRLLHRKHNVTTTRQSIFKFVKRYSSTGVLAPATRRDNIIPRKLTDFHRRCIDMWLRHNSELTSQALVNRLFRVFDVRVTTWIGAQGHYNIVNWSATKTNFVEYSGHWMHLDPKKHLITSYLLLRLLLRWVLMRGFFFTRELQIWIFCQLIKWSRNMHPRYVLINKCFREGRIQRGARGNHTPYFFDP